MIWRLVGLLVALLMAWVGAGSPAEATPAPGLPASTYAYDGHHDTVLSIGTTTERGSPAVRHDYALLPCADDYGSRGVSTRLHSGSIWTYTTYDQAVRSEQLDAGRATTRTAAEARPSDLRSVLAVSVAANTGRVFTSADTHVAGAANTVEAALPGRVVGVNSQRLMSNGLSREVDIDLGKLIVQVKGGNARGITGQIARTEASTGTPTIGYAPGITDAAWRNAASQWVPILRSPSELLAYIREFG